jgi:rfaE bifunctional protein kinase chain/domain
VAGADEAARYAGDWLEEQRIAAHILIDPDRPTTVKRRYRARDKTLLRVNRLSQQQIDRDRQGDILKILESILPETDILIFADFSYGVLPPSLVDAITGKCLALGVPMSADSQSSSQVGDLGKFRQTILMTPTELEARHAMRDFTKGLVALTEELMTRTGTRNVMVTLGENGCLIYGSPEENRIFTDNLPALNPHPLDVAGAGDSLLATASLALAAGADVWRAALLGSLAAGIQVGRLGNAPLNRADLRLSLDAQGKTD